MWWKSYKNVVVLKRQLECPLLNCDIIGHMCWDVINSLPSQNVDILPVTSHFAKGLTDLLDLSKFSISVLCLTQVNPKSNWTIPTDFGQLLPYGILQVYLIHSANLPAHNSHNCSIRAIWPGYVIHWTPLSSNVAQFYLT